MKHIWSPWRMEFIEAVRKKKGCVLCKIRCSGRACSADLVLYRGKHCYVIMNRYPYNNGHLMVIPYVHKAELADINGEIQKDLLWLTGESVRILKKVLGCRGANCGMNIGKAAGAGVAGHIHMHVVPRWVGDLNFMPIVANVKSMPEYLEDTYKKLKPDFDKL